MFENYFDILELVILFVSFPFFLRIFNSIKYEGVFKKGYTGNIQIIYVVVVFIISFVFSNALRSIMEMFYNIIT